MNIFKNNSLEIKLRVIPFFTLSGRKNLYLLPDTSYGEWIIYKGGLPKYYFNAFYKEYELFIKDLTSSEQSIERFLNKVFKRTRNELTTKTSTWGIRNESKSFIKTFILEKLPVELLI